LEFIWKPKFETLEQGSSAASKDPQEGIFTHITHEMYQGGCGIDMWIYQSEATYTKNLFKSKIEDLKSKNETFVACIEKYVSHYKTKQVLFTLGTDFAFQFAELSYKYIDEFVEVALAHPRGGKKFKFVYSTVQEYVDAVKAEQRAKSFEWPVYEGDFYPLTGNFPGHTWSGYYTSRPNFKRFIR
jgi:lysosomal alpha-mannosidase